MRPLRWFGYWLPLSLVAAAFSPLCAGVREDADAILETAGFTGGFIVHVGPIDGRLTAALKKNSATQVQGIVKSASEVEQARKAIRASAAYGEVAVDQFDGFELPYVDNLVNLLVIEQLSDLPKSEVLRVLVPNGVALIKDDQGKWVKTVKPRPKNIDDWSHYLHDASGNAVAHDDVVAPPRHLQWVGSPRWSRHHDRMASMSACVSSGGACSTSWTKEVAFQSSYLRSGN